jgi:hypothetical protein
MTIKELYNTCETLLSIHADAYFFPILVPHHGKYDRWNIEVVEEGIDDLHLLSRRPDNVFHPL